MGGGVEGDVRAVVGFVVLDVVGVGSGRARRVREGLFCEWRLSCDGLDQLGEGVSESIVSLVTVRPEGACEGMVEVGVYFRLAYSGWCCACALCGGRGKGFVKAEVGCNGKVFVG